MLFLQAALAGALSTQGAFAFQQMDCTKYPVHCATLQEDPQLVASLVHLGFDINAKDSEGQAPIHLLVNLPDERMLEPLLAQGAAVNAPNAAANTVLHLATNANKASLVSALLSHGADPNAAGAGGQTPLMVAEDAHVSDTVFQALLPVSDLGRLDARQRSVVHLAAAAAQCSRLQVLLAHGANPNLKEAGDGMAALHLAAVADAPACIDALLSAHADLEARDMQARTPFLTAVAARHGETAGHLAAAGAQVNANDSAGKNALHLAVEIDDAALVERLVALNVDKNRNGGTIGRPLAYAITGGKSAAAAALYKAHAVATGLTPDPVLHLAIQAKQPAVLRSLIAAAAPLNQAGSTNSYPGTPVYFAVTKNDPEALGILIEAGANLDQEDSRLPLAAALRLRRLPLFEALVAGGADPNRRYYYDDSHPTKNYLIHEAVADGLSDFLAVLLKSPRLDLNLMSEGADCETALYAAAADPYYRAQDAVMIAALVQRGADVNKADCHGSTPYGAAALHHGLATLALLEQAGAVIDLVNADGTPLYLAVFASHHPLNNKDEQDYLMHLVEASHLGSDARDGQGRTLAHLAAMTESDAFNSISDEQRRVFMERLAKLGADFSLQDQDGNTVLHLECLVDAALDEMKTLDVRNAKGETPLLRCLQQPKRGGSDFVAAYVKKGGDFAARDGQGESAWHAAVRGRKPNLIMALARDPSYQSRQPLSAADQTGRTALHLAADLGYSLEVYSLLTADARIRDLRDGAGKRALDLALAKDRHWSTEILKAWPQVFEDLEAVPDDSEPLQGFDPSYLIPDRAFLTTDGRVVMHGAHWTAALKVDGHLDWFRADRDFSNQAALSATGESPAGAVTLADGSMYRLRQTGYTDDSFTYLGLLGIARSGLYAWNMGSQTTPPLLDAYTSLLGPWDNKRAPAALVRLKSGDLVAAYLTRETEDSGNYAWTLNATRTRNDPRHPGPIWTKAILSGELAARLSVYGSFELSADARGGFLLSAGLQVYRYTESGVLAATTELPRIDPDVTSIGDWVQAGPDVFFGYSYRTIGAVDAAGTVLWSRAASYDTVVAQDRAGRSVVTILYPAAGGLAVERIDARTGALQASGVVAGLDWSIMQRINSASVADDWSVVINGQQRRDSGGSANTAVIARITPQFQLGWVSQPFQK